MIKVYKRTENGITAIVSQREGMGEINHAQMGGRRDVRTMSSITRTDFAIEYKDGRSVRLVLIDAPAPEGFVQGQPVVVQHPGQPAFTGTVAHIHTAPGYVAVRDDRWGAVVTHPTRFVSSADVEEESELQEWGTTTASMLAHKFHGEGPATVGADCRAKCNKGIRWYARPLTQTEGPRLQTRSEFESAVFESGERMYRFCPRCEKK